MTQFVLHALSEGYRQLSFRLFKNREETLNMLLHEV